MQTEQTVEVTLGAEAVLKTLELDVPEVTGRRLPAQSDAFGAGAAGVCNGSQVSVAWRADAQGEAVEVWPLELTHERMPSHGSKLRIKPPFPVLPNCVAICVENGSVVVDFITDVGVLYTVVLAASWLVDSNAVIPAPAVISRSFRPHSLESAPPRLLKAVSTETLVLALADGTLMRLDRGSALTSPVQSTFAEHYSTGLGAGLAKIFRAGADRVPGRPDLALRSAISLALVDRHVVTYSVDGSLRLWSLESSTCVQIISAPPQVPLRTRPATLLASEANRILVAHTSELHLYELQSNSSLKRLDAETAEVPSFLRSWFTTGLVLRADSSALIAYKTNLSARIFAVRQGVWTQIGGYDLATYLDLPADATVQSVAKRVLQTSDSVLRSALSQLVPKDSRGLNTPSISESFVRDTIVLLAGDGSDERTQWLRLDTLCREIEVADAELLAVAPAVEAPKSLGWTIRASSFTLLSSDLGSEVKQPESRRRALDLAEGVLQLVPESILVRLSARLLSTDMLLDRVDDVCDLVRPYLDSKQLNEIGRQHSQDLAAAISDYAKTYAPSSTEKTAVVSSESDIKLSGLGSLAVTELIRSYAGQQSRAFLFLAVLAVIGLVEGWFTDEGNAEPLRGTLACHERLAFVAALDAKSLQAEIRSAQLGYFGLHAARELTAKINATNILASMLLPVNREASRKIRARYNHLASIVANIVCASELTTLRGLAALASDEQDVGEELLRRVAPARRWPALFGPRPATVAAWFANVVRYARECGAQDAAFRLARTGAVLSSREEGNGEGYDELLTQLFELSLEHGDVSVAYTALVRRYAPDSSGSEAWISSFIDAVARKDPEGMPKQIATLPFVGLTSQLAQVLSSVPVFGSVPSYKVRYAWHVEHEDFVGAALALYEHLHRDSSDALRKNALYTMCLNALALLKHDARWLIFKDRVVTYDDIRSEFNALIEAMAKSASAA